MKRVVVLFSIGIVVFLFTGFQTDPVKDQSHDCQFVSKSLKDISSIKIGMTRSDLLKKFEEEGGISTRSNRRYVYQKCIYIKVDVTFRVVGNEPDKLIESPDDIIIDISKPFLEYSITG